MAVEFVDKRIKAQNHVKSVYYRKSDNQWCLEFLLDGKRQYEYRKTEYGAKKRANYWRQQFGEPLEPLPDRAPKGQTSVARFWEGQLRKCSNLLLEDPGNESYHDTANVMAKLAVAAVRTVDHIPPGDDDSSEAPAEDLSHVTTGDLERMMEGEDGDQ